MISEIIPEAYDVIGREVFRPDLRRHYIHPTFPMGRYVSQPLVTKCQSIFEVRKFLMSCQAVSDEKLFGKRDYWQPPEDFERLKKGDCEDFSLWTWRQFMSLGYDSRVVFGRHGRYGTGHAWVTFRRDDKDYLVEPQLRYVGETFPKLSTLQYHPKLSVAWDGSKIRFYSHEDRHFVPTLGKTIPLLFEWFSVWPPHWAYMLARLPDRLVRAAYRKLATRSV